MALVFAGYWLLVAGTLVLAYAPGPRRSVDLAVASAAIDAASLLLVWLVACAAAATLPLTGRVAPRNLLLTLTAAVAVLLLRIVLLRAALTPLGWFGGIDLVYSIRSMLPRNLLTFAVFWTGGWALVHYRRAAADRLRATTLRLHLVRARLTALIARLQPHFIGNTLHAASSLVDEAPVAARRMLSGLRAVITAATEDTDVHEVRLAEELDFIERWLEVQEQRFLDSLSFSITADSRAMSAYVPRLILQPLVENVVLHAVGGARHPVRLQVTGRVRGTELHLLVEDNGPGLAATAREPRATGTPGGLGIANSRERLAVLYGDAAALEVRDRPGGGAVAHVRLPLMSEPVLKHVSEDGGAREPQFDDPVRAPVPRPAEPWVIALACAIITALLAAENLAGSPSRGVDDVALACVIAFLRIGSILLPAALAFRIPALIPLGRGRQTPVALTAATALLAAAAVAALLAREGLLALLGVGAFAPAGVALQAVHVGVVLLNVLAGGYVSRHVAVHDEELGALREAEASVLHAREVRMTAGLEMNAVNAAFDRIEASIGIDSNVAIREIAGLSQRLNATLRVPT